MIFKRSQIQPGAPTQPVQPGVQPPQVVQPVVLPAPNAKPEVQKPVAPVQQMGVTAPMAKEKIDTPNKSVSEQLADAWKIMTKDK